MTAPAGLDAEALLAELAELARAAGEVVLRYYRGGTGVRSKADASPVTDADEASERLILERLAALTPDIPAVSEEALARGEGPQRPGGTCWLVDPLDGTREFIAANGEFTINLGLVRDGRPVLGVIHAPALATTYAGSPAGAWRRHGAEPRVAIRARRAPAAGLVVLSSRSHGDRDALAAFLDGMAVAEHRRLGSALKFGLLAEGSADLYPRLGPTMEWDTAAGHAILEAAGGTVSTVSGGRLVYGKPRFRNPDFIARGAA